MFSLTSSEPCDLQVQSLLLCSLRRRYCTPPKSGALAHRQCCVPPLWSMCHDIVNTPQRAPSESTVLIVAGWDKFYPKGKGRRPDGAKRSAGAAPLFDCLTVSSTSILCMHLQRSVATSQTNGLHSAEPSNKGGEKDSSLGETLQGGSLGQSLLFAAFVTLGLGLLNMSRSDSQVLLLASMQTRLGCQSREEARCMSSRLPLSVVLWLQRQCHNEYHLPIHCHRRSASSSSETSCWPRALWTSWRFPTSRW